MTQIVSRPITPRLDRQDDGDDARAVKASKQGGLTRILSSIKISSTGGDASKQSTPGKVVESKPSATPVSKKESDAPTQKPPPPNHPGQMVEISMGSAAKKVVIPCLIPDGEFIEVILGDIRGNFYFRQENKVIEVTTKGHLQCGSKLTPIKFVRAWDDKISNNFKWKHRIKLEHFEGISIGRFLQAVSEATTTKT